MLGKPAKAAFVPSSPAWLALFLPTFLIIFLINEIFTY